MKRNGTMRVAWPLLLLALTMMLAAPPAEAQLWRTLGLTETDGEPTDPDGVLRVLNEVGITDDDLETSGISSEPPAAEAEESAWWDAILDLLRELGLLEEDADR